MLKKNDELICHVLVIIIILCSMFFSACTEKKIIKISSDGKGYENKQASSLNGMKSAEEFKRKAAFKQLKANAEQFVETGDYQKALNTYSKILGQSDQQEKQLILEEIDQLLIHTDPDIIKKILESEDNRIPESMLMYRLGLNLISNDNYSEAREVLISLLEKYPDYKRADDVREILQMLKEHAFKKNTIGCMLPLSGRFSVFGQRALKGIEMAVNDLSKEYGKNIVIIIKNTKSDNSLAVQCVKELAEKKVAAIAGPMITSELAGKEADQLGIPIIIMTQKSQIAKEGNYIFSNFITPEMQVSALVSFATMHLNIRKFAVLYPDDRYGKTYMGLFLDKVDEADADIAGVESYNDGQTDFSAVIKKLITSSLISSDTEDSGSYIGDSDIDGPVNTDNSVKTGNQSEHDGMNEFFVDDNEKKQSEKGNAGEDNITKEQSESESDKPVINFQALFIPDKASSVSLILPQIAYNDVTGIYLLGTNIWHDPALIKNAAEYAKNSVITEGYFADSKNLKAHEFAEEFYRLYNEKPGFIAAVAYDTAAMLIKTAMDPSINSRKALRDALAGKRIFDGVTGKTIFGDDGNARKELFFLTVKKGKFVEINR